MGRRSSAIGEFTKLGEHAYCDTRWTYPVLPKYVHRFGIANVGVVPPGVGPVTM